MDLDNLSGKYKDRIVSNDLAALKTKIEFLESSINQVNLDLMTRKAQEYPLKVGMGDLSDSYRLEKLLREIQAFKTLVFSIRPETGTMLYSNQVKLLNTGIILISTVHYKNVTKHNILKRLPVCDPDTCNYYLTNSEFGNKTHSMSLNNCKYLENERSNNSYYCTDNIEPFCHTYTNSCNVIETVKLIEPPFLIFPNAFWAYTEKPAKILNLDLKENHNSLIRSKTEISFIYMNEEIDLLPNSEIVDEIELLTVKIEKATWYDWAMSLKSEVIIAVLGTISAFSLFALSVMIILKISKHFRKSGSDTKENVRTVKIGQTRVRYTPACIHEPIELN